MTVGGTSPRDVMAIASRVGRMGEVLLADLTAELENIAGQVVAECRAEITGVPVRYYRGTHDEIAFTVASDVTPGPDFVRVAIVSDGYMMPPGKEHLPILFDNASFRHPVFGDMDNWVEQVGAPGWFHDTIERNHDAFQTAIENAMEAAVRFAEGH